MVQRVRLANSLLCDFAPLRDMLEVLTKSKPSRKDKAAEKHLVECRTMSSADTTRQPTLDPNAAEHQIIDTVDTACCIVGAGPGGAVLALLLARAGISVTLLEAHEDFDRDFRGDTIHPSVLHIIDELGLAERLHQFRHSKIYQAAFATPAGPFTLADFRRVEKKFPYIMMLPQAQFLEFITTEAKRYPNFCLLLGASVQELIEDEDAVRGVRYRSHQHSTQTGTSLAGWHEVRATLTIGADGRSSRMRKLGGFAAVKTSPPMDILWFRIPRKPTDPEGVLGRFGQGHALVMLDRLDEWQVAYVIMKGSYARVHEAGLEALRKSIAMLLTEFPDRIEYLKDWKQTAVLNVESSRVCRWYRPGLLLIGDAAHVMSPVGGVGINYAIQDAVVAANVLSAPLRIGIVAIEDLREVQRQREWPVKVIQWIQTQIQKRVIAAALRSDKPLQIPAPVRFLLRVPILRDLPARIIAFGVRRVQVQTTEKK
jgi:2-polyprenyl-6-methoxyphenol hydroxylase-like FAD-dependent oxidoreductase